MAAMEIEQLQDGLTIGGMNVSQIRKLQKWWFAQGRTIADIDKRHVVEKTSIRKDAVDLLIIENGPIKMDETQKLVLILGKEFKITPREYELLRKFMRHVGFYVPKDDIVKIFGNPNSESSITNMRAHMCQLKKKLTAEFGVDIISSRQGFGYRMEKL